MSVHCKSAAQRERAKMVLQETGAEDISATTESTKGLGRAHAY
jgi:hypothetical protein